MFAIRRCLLVVIGAAAFAAAQARAEDFERGKSGQAIFAADCSACHRTAQGLAYGMSPSQLMDLLRQHYTTGPGPANQLASYLLSVVGNGRRPKERPLMEPQPAAANAGEAAEKRHARPEELGTAPIQRPPADINGDLGREEIQSAPVDPRQPGLGPKRRQQVTHPVEPTEAERPKKPPHPANAARASQPEAAQQPEPPRVHPAQAVAPKPSQAVPTGQPSSPPERRSTESAAAPAAISEPAAAQAVPSPPEANQAQAAATAAPAAPPDRTPAESRDDQPAFSAPSP